MKIKILYVIENAYFGGGERAFAQIINGLDKEKYEIYVACLPQGLFMERISHRAEVLPWEIKNRLDLFKINRLVRIIKEKNIDIVHSQGPRADFYARVAGKLAKLPRIVSTVATPVENFDVNIFKKAIYVFLDRLSERYVARFAVVSEALRERLIKAHKVPAEKVVKIYNGIEVNEYDGEPAAAYLRQEFGAGEGMALVGAIGRLVYQKGWPYFIQAVKHINDNCPQIAKKVKYLIVGEGELRKELEGLVKKLELKEKIIFTGFRKDIKEILSSLDVFVLPSVQEGQPIIILEAMARSKPIIATDIAGVNESIINGVNGILIPSKNYLALAEAIIYLLNDREKARSLGQAARKYAEGQFDIRNKVSAYAELYEALMPERRGAD